MSPGPEPSREGASYEKTPPMMPAVTRTAAAAVPAPAASSTRRRLRPPRAGPVGGPSSPEGSSSGSASWSREGSSEGVVRARCGSAGVGGCGVSPSAEGSRGGPSSPTFTNGRIRTGSKSSAASACAVRMSR